MNSTKNIKQQIDIKQIVQQEQYSKYKATNKYQNKQCDKNSTKYIYILLQINIKTNSAIIIVLKMYIQLEINIKTNRTIIIKSKIYIATNSAITIVVKI